MIRDGVRVPPFYVRWYYAVRRWFLSLFPKESPKEREAIRRSDWRTFVKQSSIDLIPRRAQKRETFYQIMSARKIFA